jgi:hypothetical protein
MILTLEEVDKLAMGLDLLVKQQKDSIMAAAELLPLRQKLNEEAKRLKEESDGPKP